MTGLRMRTSETHPLRIDAVQAPGHGWIGMTFCPGRKQNDAMTGPWDRDLARDLDVIREWGAVAVVTLMEQHELIRFRVPALGDMVRQRGLEWYHLPIVDGDVPCLPFETGWKDVGPKLRLHLTHGKRIVLHCRGGLGRTGTIAARLLVELGMPAGEAIRAVRQARPATIETGAQEAHVRSIRHLPLASRG